MLDNFIPKYRLLFFRGQNHGDKQSCAVETTVNYIDNGERHVGDDVAYQCNAHQFSYSRGHIGLIITPLRLFCVDQLFLLILRPDGQG